jgi:hypothetical protein
MRLKLEETDDIENELIESGLELMDYNRRLGLENPVGKKGSYR